MFSHAGAPTAFSWTPIASFADVMNYSAISSANGKQVIEFSIKRSALGTIKNFVNFAIVESTSGWAEVGKIPKAATPDSKFLAVAL